MKKNCDIVKDLLPLYIDKVCSKNSEKLVTDHLKDCLECQKYFQSLKCNIKENKKNEINTFKKFIKNINFKIIRNSILITCLILVIIIISLYFYGKYEFTLDYNSDMEILLLNNPTQKEDWNFQINAKKLSNSYATWKYFYQNGEKTNVIFITNKASIQSYLEDMKAGTVPELDYKNIDLNDKIQVYYTTDNFNNIKNSSNKELQSIINKSKLIFSNEQKSTKVICNLNNQEYSYTLTYYKGNKQIIHSLDDDTMPLELLNDIYSYNGVHKRIWYVYDTFDEVYDKTKSYMQNRGGECKTQDTQVIIVEPSKN